MKLRLKHSSVDALTEVACSARAALASNKIDRKLLAAIYQDYNPLDEVHLFIERSLEIFPSLSCGVASVYLKHVIGRGNIIRGSYRGINHSFYRSNCGQIVDITADQFGGPKVYVGALRTPWSATALTSAGQNFLLTSPANRVTGKDYQAPTHAAAQIRTLLSPGVQTS